jgi:flagellar biosynthesis/type III secretory pathway protein FliH
MQQTGSEDRGGGPGFEVYDYPASPDPPMPSWEAWGGIKIVDSASGIPVRQEREAPGLGSEEIRHAACEQRLDEEVRRSFEAGRERGSQEGRALEREAQASFLLAKDKLRMEQAARLTESVVREKERFLQTVEHEVVKLALAVAARILRREAQMDPLLLTGAVRVALGQLSASTGVRIRVPAAELDLWVETIALLPNLAVKPDVLAGDGMRLGECVIETELGSVDLGVRAQLGEIERGFFDRAGQNALAQVKEPATVEPEVLV